MVKECSIFTLRSERFGNAGVVQLGCSIAIACAVMSFLWEMTSTSPEDAVPVRGGKSGRDQQGGSSMKNTPRCRGGCLLVALEPVGSKSAMQGYASSALSCSAWLSR